MHESECGPQETPKGAPRGGGGLINGAFWNPLKEPGGDEWGHRELPYRSPDGGMNESACGPREALKGALREGDE